MKSFLPESQARATAEEPWQRWNETAAPYPKSKGVHQLFAEQAKRSPTAVAVVTERETLSYRELDRRASDLAAQLVRRGVGANTFVPLILERSAEVIVALLGVLKAGAAYVPLEPEHPDERLGFLLKDAAARVVLTQRRFAGRVRGIAGGDVEVITLDERAGRVGRAARAPKTKSALRSRRAPAIAKLAAYVIYTSGTTGRPKGVILEHPPLTNRIVWMQRAYGLKPADRVLQKTPYSFDVSGWEFFWPLMVGARLVFARPEGHKDPAYLCEVIQREKITTLHFVPSMLRAFLAAPGVAGCTSLRRVICSGEALPVPLKDQFFRVFPHVELHNLYGPTEAAIDVTYHQCRKEDTLVPIGRPIANTQILILDDALKPVPLGAEGELCIAGECLARGYLNRPELTAEKFVAHPLQPGARIYRTGDRARWLPDGSVEYLGRTDSQIKIRGNRVELGEIEATLLEQPGVTACAVVAAGGDNEELKLAAYVVPDAAAAPGVFHRVRVADSGRSSQAEETRQDQRRTQAPHVMDDRLEGVSIHTLANGLEVAHLNAGETDFLEREIFGREVYLRHGIEVNDGDCVWDIGANIGLFSVALLTSRRGLRLHAFEPIPDVHRVLALNGELFGGTLRAHDCGLSETTGEADFTFFPNVSIISGGEADLAGEHATVRAWLRHEHGDALRDAKPEEIDALIRSRLETRTVRCRLKTISQAMREQRVDQIDLLKIDVEKMEARVLGGIEDADWPRIRQIVMEVHDVDGRVDQLTALLRDKGFTVVAERDEQLGGARIFQVYARRPARVAAKRVELPSLLGCVREIPCENPLLVGGVPSPRDSDSEPTASVSSQDKQVSTAQGTLPGGRDAWCGPVAFGRRLREAVRARLPAYMEPNFIVPLAELPLTSSGKVDRKALALRSAAPPPKRARVLPRSVIESRLIDLWEELLGVVGVGLDDRFFELGGNSLLAVRVAEKISREFGARFTVVSLLELATVRAIAAQLVAAQQALPAAESAKPAAPLNSAQRDGDAELAEIERALKSHPSIRDSVVVRRTDGAGESLIACAIPNEEYFAAQRRVKGSGERLGQWVSVWERNYEPILAGETSAAGRLNAIGYVRSDSGEQIPEPELRECIDSVVQQVMAHRPQTLLEIGCGTGMLLFELAPRVERYLATDLSENAIAHIRTSLADKPWRERVSCYRCDASDLSAVPVEQADVVMINSVIQYFPGIEYLTPLLETLARRLPPKARIFVGDVRDLRLLRAFHAWTLQRQCAPNTTKRQFRRLLADRVKLEKEMVIHPHYFQSLAHALPRVRQVRIKPKTGRFPNEFIRFRYDVELCLDDVPAGPPPATVRSWTPGDGALGQALDHLAGAGNAPIYITGIPNQRLGRECAILDWLAQPGPDVPLSDILEKWQGRPAAENREDPHTNAEAENRLGSGPQNCIQRRDAAATLKEAHGVDPAACLAWAAERGLEATLHWEHNAEDGRFDLFVRPAGSDKETWPNLDGQRASAPERLNNLPSFSLDWEAHVPVLKQWLAENRPGRPLPTRFLFVPEFPRLDSGEIDRVILTRARNETAAVAPASSADLAAACPDYYDTSLAIIGLSGVFPGAKDIHALWRNLLGGLESIRVYSETELVACGVPEIRRRHLRFVPVRAGIDGRAHFDADFFRIPPAQAANMDPQARLLLQHAWRAIEDAGYAPRSIPQTGVYLSAANTFYPQALGLDPRDLQGMDGHEAGGFAQPGMMPAWVSYHLGLKGPSLFVQSLCCSSMTGLQLASRSLLSGETEYALVGAASLFAAERVGYLHEPELNLSPDGHCRSFDAAANGMVEGEAACVVLLKRACDAVRDGDPIYALLRGVAVTTDGADKAGFSAPGLGGQTDAIRRALASANVSADSIRYLEAHGAGTPLGDSIELAALRETYGRGAPRPNACGLGSTKPNIGNVDTVTGLVGCVKLALSLRHGVFPPVAQFRAANPDLRLGESPFYVVTRPESWEREAQPRRAAQHVYSLGGMNAHAIYEEVGRVSTDRDAPEGPSLVPLSARTAERLQVCARQLADFLRDQTPSSPAAQARLRIELAYTLQVGREPMEHRVVIFANDLAELRTRLDHAADGRAPGEGIVAGTIASPRDLRQLLGDETERRGFTRRHSAERRWDRLAELWVRGVEVEWRELYGVRPPHRLNLPSYPFREDSHQLLRTQPSTPTVQPPSAAVTTGTGPKSQGARVGAALRAIVGELLGSPAEAISGDRTFGDLGFDSVRLIRLSNRLNEQFGLNLTPAVFFEHSIVARLTSYLEANFASSLEELLNVTSELSADAGGPATAGSPRERRDDSRKIRGVGAPHLQERQAIMTSCMEGPSAVLSNLQERPLAAAASVPRDGIAIIGLSVKFPQAPDVAAFWRNLLDGRDCITEVPADRWSWREHYGDPNEDPRKTKIKWGGFIDGLAEFDPLFFNLSPSEAEAMDPQNRLLMMHVWLAMEDAGYAAATLSGTRTGLFLGAAESGYGRLLAAEKDHLDYGFLGVSPFGGPNRMSYFLNLKGPSEPINTGCSSSLVAVHKAVRALEAGECDLAFAGGVNAVPTPDGHISFGKVGMLCEDGRCKAFASDANGFVRGEGVGVIVLKRLREAEADGDHIEAVIIGSAENHGGRANSFTAPNPGAQAELIEAALRKAGVNPATIGCIEAHGTGTKLGDPVEVEGLKKAFAAAGIPSGRRGACGIGSVKSNIGHLESAAGIAGLIKALLQLKHQTLVRTLHCAEINPYLQFGDSPFYVVRENVRWVPAQDEQGHCLPRRAGVSSFGIGGVNAHVVLEEYADVSPGCRVSVPSKCQRRPAAENNAEVQTRGGSSIPAGIGFVTKFSGETPPPLWQTADSAPHLIVLSGKTDSALRERAEQLRALLRERPALTRDDLRDIAYTLQMGRDAMEERLALIADSRASLENTLHDWLEGRPVVACRDDKTIPLVTAGTAGIGRPVDGACFRGRAGAGVTATGVDVAAWIERRDFASLPKAWVGGVAVEWNDLYRGAKPKRVSLPGYPFARERYWVTPKRFEPKPSSNIAHSNAVAPGNAGADDVTWQPSAVPEHFDWLERLRQRSGQPIAVIYADERERDEFCALLQQMAESAGLARGFRVQSLPSAALADADFSEPPATVFVLRPASGRDALLALNRVLRTRLAATRLHILALHSGVISPACGFATHAVHTWKLIEADDAPATVTPHQRLFREWLRDGDDAPAGVPLAIRFDGERRFVRPIAPQPQKSPQLLEKHWIATAALEATETVPDGATLFLVNEESAALIATLAFAPAIVVGGAEVAEAATDFIVDFRDATNAAAHIPRVVAACAAVSRIVDLSDFYRTPCDRDEDKAGKLMLYQAIVGRFTACTVLHVTQGLQAFAAERMSLAGAKFAGLIKMLGAEYAHIRAKSVDVDAATWNEPRWLAGVLASEFRSDDHETEVCFRAGVRHVPQLVAVSPEATTAEFSVRPDAVYLISGGTSGIGLEIARHLVARGARKLALLGIRPLPPQDEWERVLARADLPDADRARLAPLRELARQVELLRVHTTPLTDRAALHAFVDQVRRVGGPIAGVVHSAGAYPEGNAAPFVTRGAGQMARVFEPKISGLEALHEVFAASPPDFFVSFSSLTGVIPRLARGMSDYALANAYLDYFAAYQFHQHRRRHYRTITWVDWKETGFAARMSAAPTARLDAELEEIGLAAFANCDGRRLFDLALSQPDRSWVLPCFLERPAFEAVRAELLRARGLAWKFHTPNEPTTPAVRRIGGTPAAVWEQTATGVSPLHEISGLERAGASAAVDGEAGDSTRLDRQLSEWEKSVRPGAPLAPDALQAVIPLAEIRQLDPARVGRIYQLLFPAARPAAPEGSERPRAGIAEQVRKHLFDVLKIKQVDNRKPFQDYGLDSISAMVFSNRLEKEMKRAVPPAWLIDFPTVELLTLHLERQRAEAGVASRDDSTKPLVSAGTAGIGRPAGSSRA